MYFNCKTLRPVSVGNEDISKKYFKDIRQIKPLPPDEQIRLLKEYKETKDEKKKIQISQKILASNQPFIVSVARHISTGEEFNDLISEGNIGLYKAIDMYDTDRGVNFLSFALYHIVKQMKDYLNEVKNCVKPLNLTKVSTYVEQYKNRYFCEHGYFPTPEQLMDVMENNGIVFSNKTDLYEIIINSIDSNFNKKGDSDDDGEWFENCLYHNGLNESCDALKYVNSTTTKQMVEQALSCLTDKEREMICRYYGIGYTQMTPNEIAFEMKLKERNGVLDRDGKKIEKDIKRIIKKIRKNGKVNTNIQ